MERHLLPRRLRPTHRLSRQGTDSTLLQAVAEKVYAVLHSSRGRLCCHVDGVVPLSARLGQAMGRLKPCHGRIRIHPSVAAFFLALSRGDSRLP